MNLLSTTNKLYNILDEKTMNQLNLENLKNVVDLKDDKYPMEKRVIMS